MTLTQKSIIEYAQKYSVCDSYFKIEWDCHVFMIKGKLFGLVGEHQDKAILSVKGDPLENGLLRQEYSFIIPGYHLNKQHWITIFLSDTDNEDLVHKLLDTSYAIIVGKLPQKTQKLIELEAAAKEQK